MSSKVDPVRGSFVIFIKVGQDRPKGFVFHGTLNKSAYKGIFQRAVELQKNDLSIYEFLLFFDGNRIHNYEDFDHHVVPKAREIIDVNSNAIPDKNGKKPKNILEFQLVAPPSIANVSSVETLRPSNNKNNKSKMVSKSKINNTDSSPPSNVDDGTSAAAATLSSSIPTQTSTAPTPAGNSDPITPVDASSAAADSPAPPGNEPTLFSNFEKLSRMVGESVSSALSNNGNNNQINSILDHVSSHVNETQVSFIYNLTKELNNFKNEMASIQSGMKQDAANVSNVINSFDDKFAALAGNFENKWVKLSTSFEEDFQAMARSAEDKVYEAGTYVDDVCTHLRQEAKKKEGSSAKDVSVQDKLEDIMDMIGNLNGDIRNAVRNELREQKPSPTTAVPYLAPPPPPPMIAAPQVGSRLGNSTSCISCSKFIAPGDSHYNCTGCKDHLACLSCGPWSTHCFKPLMRFEVNPAPGSQRDLNAICDMCNSGISGKRMKCLTCPDFDMCSACFQEVDLLHPTHTFVEVTNLHQIKPQPRQVPFLHKNVNCNGCHKEIKGARFICVNDTCEDINLCQACEALPIVPPSVPITHTSKHVLLKVPGYVDFSVSMVKSAARGNIEIQNSDQLFRNNISKPKAPWGLPPSGNNSGFPEDPVFDSCSVGVRPRVSVPPPPPPPSAPLRPVSPDYSDDGEATPPPKSPANRPLPLVYQQKHHEKYGQSSHPFITFGGNGKPTGLRHTKSFNGPESFKYNSAPQAPGGVCPHPKDGFYRHRHSISNYNLNYGHGRNSNRSHSNQRIKNFPLKEISRYSYIPPAPPAPPPMQPGPAPFGAFDAFSRFAPPPPPQQQHNHHHHHQRPSMPAPHGPRFYKSNPDFVGKINESKMEPDDKGKGKETDKDKGKETEAVKTRYLNHLDNLVESFRTHAKSHIENVTTGPSPLMCYFIKDVTITDHQDMVQGARFDKIWEVINTGNQTWPVDTKLVHVGGFGSDAVAHPVAPLQPGDKAHLCVSDLIVPDEIGTASSYWRLVEPSGKLFGNKLWIVINVTRADDKGLSSSSDIIYPSLNANGKSGPSISTQNDDDENHITTTEDEEDEDDESFATKSSPKSGYDELNEEEYGSDTWDLLSDDDDI